MIELHCTLSKYSFLHQDNFLLRIESTRDDLFQTCILSPVSISFKPMVINIPSDSEASDATVISDYLIEEELEIQSATSPQLQ